MLSRRQFLSSSASAAAFTIVPRHVLGGPGFVPPSELVTVALIGAGDRGLTDMVGLHRVGGCRVVAVADPAEEFVLNRGAPLGRGPVAKMAEELFGGATRGFRCAAHEDFRVLLEKERGIDAVLVATPDHLHAAASVAAMRAGKHVYCEKPLAHNIWEARRVAAVAAETGVATQMGNQGRSEAGTPATVAWLRAGAVGPVREVHVWNDAKRWNPGLSGPPAGAAPPPGLNWDLWLGPRPTRPFDPAYHPIRWRDFWDFGCGALGDFGCHDIDAAFDALDLAAPRSVVPGADGHTDRWIAPHGERVRYEFGPRGKLPPVTLNWYSGSLKPKTPPGLKPDETPLASRGVLFKGDDGLMICAGAGGGPKLLRGRDATFEKPKAKLVPPEDDAHYRGWLDACKGGPAAASHFGHAAKLTELVLLGVAALRLGRPIEWDPAAMKAKGLPEADAVFREEYRKGWEIE